MFNTYIEIIVSLIVIFALLSVLVSLINEFYRSITRDRGKMMYAYIRKMLDDEKNLDLTYLIYRHPLIENTRKKNTSNPSFIEPKIFATAFIQTIGNLSTKVTYSYNNDETYKKHEERESNPLTRFSIAVKNLKDGPLKNTLRGMAERAEISTGDKYLELENQVIDWFNYQMNALTYHYKRSQRTSLLFFGFVITIGLNVDSLHLIHELRNDKELRTELNESAETIAKNYNDAVLELKLLENDTLNPNRGPEIMKLKNVIQNFTATKNEIDQLELPIGYSCISAPLSWFNDGKIKEINAYEKQRNNLGYTSVIFYLIGICISAFSLSMGAPFWFDLLNKAVGLRRGRKV